MAKARLDEAKTQESYANIEKIHAMAEHETMEADYALVRTAMELEDAQFKQIREAFMLAQEIKMSNQPQNTALAG
jgi:hypothetical protein